MGNGLALGVGQVKSLTRKNGGKEKGRKIKHSKHITIRKQLCAQKSV